MFQHRKELIPTWALVLGAVALLSACSAANAEKRGTDTAGLLKMDSLAVDSHPKPPASPSTDKTSVSAETEEIDSWNHFDGSSDMDDSPLVAAATSAVSVFPSSGVGITKEPALMVRCRQGRTDTFVGNIAGVAIGPWEDVQGAYVRIRIDQEPAQRQRWNRSGASNSVFSPSPVRLAKRLSKAKQFRLEYDSMAGSIVVVTFDVRGLDKHLNDIATACHWKSGADGRPSK